MPGSSKAYMREYYERIKHERQTPEYREYNRQVAARWRQNNREASMLSAAKARAQRSEIQFDLDLADIVIPEVCPILNIPLFFTTGKQTDNTPALDRRNNSLGYVKGNVQVISHKANRQKADLTIDDVKRLLEYMEK